MYISNIQSIPAIKECYSLLFEQFRYYQTYPENLKKIVESSFNKITSWRIAKKNGIAVYPTPYVMELMGQGFKTPSLLKKPFISLQEETKRGYNSYGFHNDNLLLDINPLQDDADNLLSCYLHENNKITNFGVRFRHFDLYDNKLTFSNKNQYSYFEILSLKHFFWLSDVMQVSVSINLNLAYYTSIFVYDMNKKLEYVVQTVHYHDNVRKQNMARERAEFVSIFHYNEQGKFSHITTIPNI